MNSKENVLLIHKFDIWFSCQVSLFCSMNNFYRLDVHLACQTLLLFVKISLLMHDWIYLHWYFMLCLELFLFPLLSFPFFVPLFSFSFQYAHVLVVLPIVFLIPFELFWIVFLKSIKTKKELFWVFDNYFNCNTSYVSGFCIFWFLFCFWEFSLIYRFCWFFWLICCQHQRFWDFDATDSQE